MRLSEIRKIILDNINKLSYATEPMPDKPSMIRIKNISTTTDAVENLSQLSFLHPTINRIKSFKDIYSARASIISTTTAENSKLKIELSTLIEQCNLIVSLTESIIQPLKENIITIELAETTNISDVKELITNLDEAFSQISNLKNYKGTVRFAGFESGSSLINLSVENSGYLILVLTMIKIAYSIVQDHQSHKLLNQRYEGVLIQNQANKDMADLLKAMTSSYVRKTAVEENWEMEPEELNFYVDATTKIAKTIADGNKITALLTEPTEKQSELKKEIAQISTQIEKLKLLAPPENITEQPAGSIDPEE